MGISQNHHKHVITFPATDEQAEFGHILRQLPQHIPNIGRVVFLGNLRFGLSTETSVYYAIIWCIKIYHDIY